MISTTPFRIAVGDQENKKTALNARKGVAQPIRKPLGDRAVNQTPVQKPLGSKSLKNCNVNIMSKQNDADVKKPQLENKYPDWLTDVCSFKNVEDTYEDICLQSNRLDTKAILDRILHPKTPPPLCDTNKYFQPALQSPPKKRYNLYDNDDIIEGIPMVDIDVPEFFL